MSRPRTRAAPGGRVEEPEQQADERALARAVGPEEAEDLALADVERHVVERPDRAAAVPGRRPPP